MRKFVKSMSKACGPMVHVTKFDAQSYIGFQYLCGFSFLFILLHLVWINPRDYEIMKL